MSWISDIAMLTHRGHMKDDQAVYEIKDQPSQIRFLTTLVLFPSGDLA